MRDTPALLAWLTANAKRLGWRNDRDSQFWILQAAEDALQGDAPPGLFAHIVAGRFTERRRFTPAAIDTARQRLRDWDESQRSSNLDSTLAGIGAQHD